MIKISKFGNRYCNLDNFFQNKNVYDEKEKPEFYGNTFPSVWCHEFDGGRQWYTSLGHDSTTYATKEFQKHIMGGIIWVIGNNKVLDYGKAHAKKPDDPLPY